MTIVTEPTTVVVSAAEIVPGDVLGVTENLVIATEPADREGLVSISVLTDDGHPYTFPVRGPAGIEVYSDRPLNLEGITARDLRPGDVLERTAEVVTAVEDIENEPKLIRVFISTDARHPQAYIRRRSAPELVRRRAAGTHILPVMIGAAA